MNKKFVMCLDCGTVQVRTDIKETIKDHYIYLHKGVNSCIRCDGKNHLATNNIRSLENYLNQKPNKTPKEQHILNLVKRK